MFSDHYIYTVLPFHVAMVIGFPAMVAYLNRKETR